MQTSRSFILASALVLAAAAQPAAATTGTYSTAASHPRAPAPQLQASLGSHLLAVIRHILAGDDTIHRG